MQAHPLETEVGIETYLTTSPGFRGKLRTKIEDFLVEEICPDGTILKSLTYHQISPKTELDLTQIPPKCYTYNIVLEKYNLDTFTTIQKLAFYLKIPYHRIGFAGLKDKRAITTQKISISGANPQKLLTIPESRFYFNRLQLGKPIRLGDLIGNQFNITIRQMENSFDNIQTTLKETEAQLLAHSLPNFYGPQRFGAIRPISHKIGRVLLRGDYEAALKIYLTDSFKQEAEDIHLLRTRLEESWPQGAESFPHKYHYENQIIQALRIHPLNFKKIFTKIFPFRYELLFIHAYQSYLFNRMLSHRMKTRMPLEEALEGDYVALLDKNSLPTNVTYEVTSKNVHSLNKAIAKKKAVIMFPLFGFDLNYSHHPQADFISKLIEQESLDLSLFKIPQNDKLTFKVVYRPITFQPENFDSFIVEPLSATETPIIKLKFVLNKGCYATILLREFMKTTPLNY
ncbi:MAG: tRNA pseudouridine(13) synthase TruD [Candidatus Helarchaeota archaeon]